MSYPAVIERQLVDQFLESLRNLPDVRVLQVFPEPPRSPGTSSTPQYDVKCNLRVAGKIITLLIDVMKVLYPRDVRQKLWLIKDFSRRQANVPQGRETVPVLVAESISPGAREILKSERVGYYDSGGSLYVPAQGVHLYVDRPLPKPLSRSIRSLFAGRRARVLHALLVHDEWYQVKKLAHRARVSHATVSQVLSELERYEWVVSRGMGPNKERHLVETGRLIGRMGQTTCGVAGSADAALLRAFRSRRGPRREDSSCLRGPRCRLRNHSRGSGPMLCSIPVGRLTGPLPAVSRSNSRTSPPRPGCPRCQRRNEPRGH